MLQLEALRTEIASSPRPVVPVDGIDLIIRPGETLALVGESGCGKSMTAMSIARLLPEGARISAGRVLLDDVDLADLPERRMREFRGARVSMIFQEPGTSLNPVLRIGEQIVEVIERHTKERGKAARARAIEWLQRVGIPDPAQRIDTFPFQLSGGQKQRVMIAIALAAEPDIVIADEPTTALDVTIQAQILELLKTLQSSRNMAMLLITHDLAIVAQMAHRVALMYAGQLVEVSDAADFFARPLHPYAVNLFDSLPETSKRGTLLASIPGTVPPLNQEFIGCRFADRCGNVMERCRVATLPLFEPIAGHQVRCVLYDGSEPAQPVVRFLAKENSITGGVAAGAPLLEVRDYKVYFPIRSTLLRRTIGHFKAVDGVSFSVPAGRTLALVGESGSGKTTVGKAVLQLLRASADISGSVLLDGRALDQLQGDALRDARRSAQIVFQDPFASLNPRMRVSKSSKKALRL